MIRSSLWSRRPSSRILCTAGHKCSRTRPTMVGLRELLPRRSCGPRARGGGGGWLQSALRNEGIIVWRHPHLLVGVPAAAKMSHDQIHRSTHRSQQTWRHGAGTDGTIRGLCTQTKTSHRKKKTPWQNRQIYERRVLENAAKLELQSASTRPNVSHTTLFVWSTQGRMLKNRNMW